jgi:predicted GNAT superfamily acetyltransferase
MLAFVKQWATMAQMTRGLTPAESAVQVAHAAASRSRVRIEVLDVPEAQRAAGRLFDSIWSSDDGPLLSAHLLRATTHAGNYLAGAWDGDALLGAAFGFLGQADGDVHLHSHVLGVSALARHRGVGFALKQHQRAWALAHELETIRWTYDPLVRCNAHFNLVKLGAEVVGYDVDFYGSMGDGVNASDESDRVHVRWVLTGTAAAATGGGAIPPPSVERLLADGAVVALDQSDDGRPSPTGRWGQLTLCRVPADIVQMRRDDPGTALTWRHALRAVLTDAFARGARATGMTGDGWYVLQQAGDQPRA